MTILKFDEEGCCFCPMNEVATSEECMECKYLKLNHDSYVGECIYKDVFPEEEE